MEESGKYKSVITRKEVLDSLRIYIDLTDDFLAQMTRAQVLTPDELDYVKKLRFPSSRNELLQILIRKQWNKDSFGSFCDILKDTQKTTLSDMVINKTKAMEQGTLTQNGHSQSTVDVIIAPDGDGDGGGLDETISALPIKKRNTIKSLLGEQAEKIRKLENENKELRDHNIQLTASTNTTTHMVQRMDRAVADTLASIQFDKVHDTVEEALLDLKAQLDERAAALKKKEEEVLNLSVTVKTLQSSKTFLTEENARFKSRNAELEKLLRGQVQTAEAKIKELESSLQTAQGTSKFLDMTSKQADIVFKKKLTAEKEENAQIKQQLEEMKKENLRLRKERDSVKADSKDVQDRTRKLLVSLDLYNECENPGLALDHARNLVIATRRKRGSISARSNSISSETFTNLSSGELENPFSPTENGSTGFPASRPRTDSFPKPLNNGFMNRQNSICGPRSPLLGRRQRSHTLGNIHFPNH